MAEDTLTEDERKKDKPLIEKLSEGARKTSNRTMMHEAAVRGNHELVKYLIYMDATIDLPDGDGRTPMALIEKKMEEKDVKSRYPKDHDKYEQAKKKAEELYTPISETLDAPTLDDYRKVIECLKDPVRTKTPMVAKARTEELEELVQKTEERLQSLEDMIDKVEGKLPSITKYKIFLDNHKRFKAQEVYRKERMGVKLQEDPKKSCCTIS